MSSYPFRLTIAVLATVFLGQTATGKPVFMGVPAKFSASLERTTLLTLAFMTADQMAEKVKSLTGFYHPGFDEYGAMIGKIDPKTGIRTNDRPTVMSVMIMEQLASEVAQCVLSREQFLDRDDRIVFKSLDLDHSPDDATLHQFVTNTCSGWLSQTCPADLERSLIQDFRATEASADGLGKAWIQFLGSLLQNGALYFY